MRALLVEDDTSQFDYVRGQLAAIFPGIEIERVSTESEFRHRFPTLAAEPPDIAVIDVMLRWADPDSEYEKMPPEIRADGNYFRAGFRCAAMLAMNERTREVPVIIYSVLDRDDVESNIRQLGLKHRFVRKETYVSNLALEIKAALLRGDRGA